jgi:murein DD-endopeptidase MepM/ murein hydrolase activator NlpD
MRWPSALLCLLLLSWALPVRAVDLVGTWYVLIHYKDDHSPNPEQERWDDRVWVFQPKGRRLEWTEYPIVVFEDDTGRFERRATGQYARILHFWEPSESQLADIRDGLQVNNRGSKSKRLRGSDADGWSSGRSMGAASASVVTYQEVWSIEGLPDRPVFRRSDILGGGRTDSMEGLTEYASVEVGPDEISGSFERDGSRHGTFRMLRCGAVGAVQGAETQQELQQKTFRREMERAVRQDPETRRRVVEEIDESLLAQGLSLPREDVEELADEVMALYLQEVPEPEIRSRLTARVKDKLTKFAPLGARHDDSVRYGWPFRSEIPRQLLNGVRGDTEDTAKGKLFRGFRRPDSMRYAFDFDLPEGTPVVAARAGEVARVVDGFEEGGPQQGMALKSNTVVVLHDDGSYAIYTHLKPGIAVKPKQRVERGDLLGQSGATGQVFEPELLFLVQRLDADGEPESVPIRFDDGTQQGVVPVIGMHYGGE